MEDRGGLSCSEMDYMKDIEEIRFGSTSDEEEEEDDDEPRLRIDTSEEDEEEPPPANHRRTSSQNRSSGAGGRVAGGNPLLSLQQLVHSPFLNTQISSGAAAAAAALLSNENQGCKLFGPLANENRSRGPPVTTINVDSRRPFGKSAMSSGAAKSRKSASSRRNSSLTNFNRLSPVSIEVVPSLSHLLMAPYDSAPVANVAANTSKADRTNSRLNYIVNKLHTSATEEEHLRQLQQLQQQSSPEAEDFRMFQQFLKSRQFQARCNSNNLEILPTGFGGGGDTRQISLVNSKGFRYTSTNAETRSTFYPNERVPQMPTLKRKPSSDSRMPPALTVIPKQGNATPRKTNCRRSPPPMVPIESIANFRKPLNEDNVVYRLKKLGTDIELEKDATSRGAADEAAVSVERICPPVTNNERTSLPFLKPIPADGPRNSVVLTKLHPPPPSLIPIAPNTGPRFVPILPASKAAVKKRPVPLSGTSRAVVQVLKKKKKRKLTAKSEYTRLAHQLVQAATPLGVARKDEMRIATVIPAFNENVVLPPRIASPPVRETMSVEEPKSTDTCTSPPTDEKIGNEDAVNETPSEEPPKDPIKRYFAFQTCAAIQVGELPNGRPMLSCDICSGVYHKMFSLKKHYYRNHINPKFVSEKHASMFKTLPPTDKLAANPKSKTALYWCSICECLFDDKSDLSSHLTDHPPLALDNAASSRLYVCKTCNMVFSKKRTQIRHSKKCVNLSTSTTKNASTEVPEIDAVVEETSNGSSKTDDVLELEDVPKNGKLETSMMCLFCELSFTDTTKRKKHVLQHHHPKRKQQPCVYCKNKTFSDLSDLLKHICEMHSKRYFGCANCKIRFRTKEDLVAHNAESHDSETMDVEKEAAQEEKVKGATTNKNGKNFKCNQCPKVFNNTVEMGRHKKAAHSGRNNIKKVVSAFSPSIDPNEQKYRSTIITTADYETEFYKNVCGNVKYNLEYCMEGRLEMKKSLDDQGERHEYSDIGLEDESKAKNDTPTPLSFQDMYGTDDIDSRFIHNVSRLHLATQLTMLRKANLLDKELDCPLRNSVPDRSRSAIATRLALAEKSEGERTENETNDTANDTVFSGEWTRARNYICGTCFARFNNFWEMEDHRWIRHPNVYGFYYEFVTEQAPGQNWAMKRSLQSLGTLGTQAGSVTAPSNVCTKCQKVITPIAEFHKHILECGGDTTWTSMMFAAHTKRNKKWRPYGSRRRRNIARHRGLKRNIPTTPVKIIGPPRNRQKAGDTETIQRMIANLPPKRITRRVITFDDIESKKNRFNNNVQTSSILTRKRKECLDTRNNATASTSRAQPDPKQSVASSNTLIGTKNNTPYNKGNNNSSHTHRRHLERQAAADKLETEVKNQPEKESQSPPQPPQAIPEVIDMTENAPQTVTESSESQCEPAPAEEPVEKIDNEISLADESSNGGKETETIDETKLPEVESCSTVTEGKIESETVPEISPAVENETKTTEPQAEPIAELKPQVDDKPVQVEQKSVTECEPNVANSEKSDNVEVVKTEPCTSQSQVVCKRKPLIIKVQGKSQDGGQPVTIIRADKKKKKKTAKVPQQKKKPVADTTPVVVADEIPVVKEESAIVEVASEPVPEKKPEESEPPKVPIPDPEEGEIDLESVIEPADENSPALPDTSVILAAMKETMRQTDAVISSMPVAVTVGKKRKRDDTAAKCKKCGLKIESGTASCESCTETPAKKSKPVIQEESYECKSCHIVVTGKPSQRADETCEKCKRESATSVTPKKPASKGKDTQTAVKSAIAMPPQRYCKCGSVLANDTSILCDKCSTIAKPKDTQCMRLPTLTPAPARCRKCDAVFAIHSSETPTFCDKCSRLQETVCLLCKSRYISDTNDKVCGKCMLAGSTKQKKRNSGPATEEQAQVTSTVDSGAETAVKSDDSSKPKTTDSKKRKIQHIEVTCDTCGKTWKDDENTGSPICRLCRQSYENTVSRESTRVTSDAEDESRKCADCSSIAQTSEVTLKKLCDGCSTRKERRSSNENKHPELSASQDTKTVNTNVFNGFGPIDDVPSRNRIEEPKIEHVKEEPNHGASDHKTPMKNVKLICRGCYGVFDTVSSYKHHCDNCKHRSTEKKPLLSFAKRPVKGSAEPSTQTDTNGASFEILEGVQIKFVEMSGNATSDKSEPGKDTPSQIPLVVYESDSSPHKKSDGSRSHKKHKRNHSSPETIMDTIESVIKSVCYNNEEPLPDNEPVEESVTDDDLPPVLERMVDQPLEKVRDVMETNLEPEQEPVAENTRKSEAEESPVETVVESRAARAKSSKSKSKKKSAKKAKKSALPKEEVKECPMSEDEQAQSGSSDTSMNESSTSKTEDSVETGREMDDGMRKDLERLSNRDISKKRFLPTNDLETIKNAIVGSRLRSRPKADTSFIPVRREQRTRSKPNESADESKNSEIDGSEVTAVDDGIDQVIPKSRKKKSETARNDAKKPKLETANDLGFAVTKTSKTIPKNSSSKKKPAEVADPTPSPVTDHQEPSKNDRSVPSRKNSAVSETGAGTSRRRSSAETSDADPSSATPPRSGSRRNSAAMSDSRGDFLDDSVPQPVTESVQVAELEKNETSCADEKSSTSLEACETPDAAAQPSTSWNDWDFLGLKSLGSILDTVNEILSRPEVSSCSSDSVDSFREEMMMFQHFGRDLSAIEKQEDESSKQEDETTTITDLDELSSAKLKAEAASDTSCLSLGDFSEDCELWDQSFTKDGDLPNHTSTVNASVATNKNIKDGKLKQTPKSNQNGAKNVKHKCNHCQKWLQNKAEMLQHMKEHWKTFAMSKSDNGSHLKNSIADKLEELLLDKALVNYLKSPQETQHRNNLPLKILNQISLAKKNQFTSWKSALAQVLDMDSNSPASTTTTSTTTSTSTATSSAPPMETVASVVPEPKPSEKPKTTSTTESTNADPVEGYPCPMCNKTFQYTRTRNTHLIMVHAPRQSTHKHLIEGKNDSKKNDKAKSSNETRDKNSGKDVAREKIFHSYLLNDSVNTVVKKESLDDLQLPPKLTPAVPGAALDAKKPAKCDLVAPKLESPSSPSSGVAPSTSSKAGKSVANSVARQSSNDDDERAGSKKKKPCRKKMSKKEMNLPAAIVKLKAEQALLQLCNSRFNRICSQ